MDEMMRVADELVGVLEKIAQTSAANDKSLLELIKVVINRVIELEHKVDMLMELHHVNKNE